jgi:MFS family permease
VRGAGRMRRRDYPGWRMVWALGLTEAVGYGVLYYSFAVFLVPMRDALHASTGALAGAFSLALATTGVAGVFAGRWLDAHGPRALMTAGSLLGAASVVGWSQVRTLPQLYLAFLGVGLAGAAVFYEPAFALINTWFERDRTQALFTLTVIAGFSSTVFLPTSQALVGALGWRPALLVLAGLLALCAVPHALLLRRHPHDLGLQVDGRPLDDQPLVGAAGADGADTDGTSVRAAWRLPPVRWLTVADVMETLAITVVSVHLLAYLRDSGAGATVAAATVGALGLLQVAGRIVLTSLAARVGLARLTAVMVAGQAAGVAALFWLPRPLALVAFVVLFGLGFGVMYISRAALLGSYVPARVFASVSGGQSLAANLGRVAAPVAAGVLISTAGYGIAFTVVATCAVLAAVSLLAADRTRPAVAPPASPPA